LKLSGINLNSLPDKYLKDLSVNNLVLTNSRINENPKKDSQNKFHILTDLNIDSLKVITFINVKLQTGPDRFEWSAIESFKNLQAIHIEGGNLEIIDQDFKKIEAQNLLVLTLDNIQLKIIEKDVFNDWMSLRMLTINRNLIKKLDWMPLVMPNLWYLDLRFNKLESIPEGLDKTLPSLRVLKLGNNEIRVMPYSTVKPLFNRTNLEFSFYKQEGIQIIFIYAHNIVVKRKYLKLRVALFYKLSSLDKCMGCYNSLI